LSLTRIAFSSDPRYVQIRQLAEQSHYFPGMSIQPFRESLDGQEPD
jgi:hypothetical protein